MGNRIRLLRKKKGATQNEVSDVIGVSRSYYAGLESGAKTLSFQNATKIAQYLGVDVDFLALGQGNVQETVPKLEETQALQQNVSIGDTEKKLLKSLESENETLKKYIEMLEKAMRNKK